MRGYIFNRRNNFLTFCSVSFSKPDVTNCLGTSMMTSSQEFLTENADAIGHSKGNGNLLNRGFKRV